MQITPTLFDVLKPLEQGYGTVIQTQQDIKIATGRPTVNRLAIIPDHGTSDSITH